MSPTIVTKDGRPFMVLGSPGGSRIITIVVQTILNVIDHGMNIQEAVNAPRIHHQWLPDEIAAERFAISPDTEKILTGMGYVIKEQSPWGAAEAIMIGPMAPAGQASSGNDAMARGGALAGFVYGGHDDRRPAGAAAGF
jgi:gamma-glutamyltranspeptidase/glutathione hydrolase